MRLAYRCVPNKAAFAADLIVLDTISQECQGMARSPSDNL